MPYNPRTLSDSLTKFSTNIQSDGNRRISSHGRGLPGGRPRVANYFEDTEGMDEGEVTHMNLQRLRDLAQELGYNSLFDVAVAEARFSPEEREGFMEAGGLEELVASFRTSIKRRIVAVDVENNRYGQDICSLSREIYAREW